METYEGSNTDISLDGYCVIRKDSPLPPPTTDKKKKKKKKKKKSFGGIWKRS